MTFIHTCKYPNLICSFEPRRPNLFSGKPNIIPARDRVIDFGKYKGKMLGSLPSTYLKWVSKNLRAGYSEPWAKLADQVLEDEVYQDRVEWDFAESVLNGNNKDGSLSRNEGAVSQLVEISERFGWDNDDKEGWSRVKLELLGTSKGGRIPRKVSSFSCTISAGSGLKDLNLEKIEEKGKVLTQSEMRRKERRKRRKLKERAEMRREKLGILMESKDRIVNEVDDLRDEVVAEVETNNPFPGREALFKKVHAQYNNIYQ